MKNKIWLNDKTFIDLAKLIASKLFIYANSGYGKSWLIRRILEQSFNQIQQIVIDPEGEFSTLREKYDYILIGKGYDITADPKTAALLAHRLLKEKVSAIIDIYELEPLDRERFVANFTQALVNVPKELAHPYLYLIDEAQDFAPEKGDALSSKAMLSIAKKGRKRGCCPIFATQRVADFSKSVIAACNNKLIGQASLDIDMKRCAAELGFSTKEQTLSLRDLDPGEFFAFGPAMTKIVQKIKIGNVFTSHPDSSKIGSKVGFKKVIPASARVKKALAALADLPQEAAEEAKTIADYKSQIKELKAKISHNPQKIVEIDLEASLKPHLIAFRSIEKSFENTITQWELYTDKLLSLMNMAAVNAEKIPRPSSKAWGSYIPSKVEKVFKNTIPGSSVISEKSIKIAEKNLYPKKGELMSSDGGYQSETLGKGEMIVLKAIAQFPDEGMTTEHIAVLTGYKQTSRRVYLQRLSSKGYTRTSGENIFITEEGMAALGSNYEALPKGDELREHLMRTLPEGEKRVLSVILAAYPNETTFETIEQETGYKTTSRRVYLQRLGARKLVEVTGNMVKASEKLYE